MPLYEYECKQCQRHTEKIQKFSDTEITVCPHCGGELKRVVSAPAIAFKGGGWYADGYGNAKPSAAKSEGSGTGSDKSGSSADVSASASKETAAKPASSDSTSSPAPAAVPAASTSSSAEKK
ncbi:MAG: zinc ribbon domain-containing protein [Acidobacteriota bacterium]|nr:zinc ribbon domain-containing protein [Acidobacteriota bacterium]